MKLLLLAALVAVALAQPLDQDLNEWETYKVKYAKNYSLEEEDMRRGIFMANLKKINAHNARFEKGEETYTMGVNKFADMTAKEFSAKMNRFRAGPVRNGEVFDMPEDEELPGTVDWRTKGAVTAVKDQGQCGSCWAFSTTGSLEGQHYLSTKKLVSLSEQNLVDCSTKNDGCEGGLMDTAFEYIKSNKGIDTESSYPYTGYDGSCHFKSKNVGATLSGYVDIPTGNEKKLQQAVTKVGPISIAIDASDNFQLYSSGVFSDSTCSNDRDDLNHGVLAVGYGVSGGKHYWLVKNSWGSDWGMSGYIMMSKNKENQCGVATLASYPKV